MMVKDGILTKLDKNQATEWLNSFVVFRKPSGKLKICLDPTDLNPHIIRPVCNSNTLDDVVHKLRKAKYYAVFDAIKGFFHVPLDDESKLLTAMLTPLVYSSIMCWQWACPMLMTYLNSAYETSYMTYLVSRIYLMIFWCLVKHMKSSKTMCSDSLIVV